MENTIISSRNFNAYFGTVHAVKNVNIDIPKNNVVFDGTPFENVIFIGNKDNQTPKSKSHELIFRLPANGI